MTTVAVNCLIAFSGGVFYESANVWWIHYSEKRRPTFAAIFSMLSALSEVAGIGESLSTLAAAPFFVLGFGVGTFIAVFLKPIG